MPYGRARQESAPTKTAQVELMFNRIAPAYDTLNHGMSLGIDYYWRRHVLDYLAAAIGRTGQDQAGPGRTGQKQMDFLDIGTGTGDFAIAVARRFAPKRLIGIDISSRMMALARRKVRQQGLDDTITLQRADCLDMPFADGTFDVATVAFGIRNLENLDKGLGEICRVLKTGGHIAIAELSRPQHFPARQLFTVYSHTMLPLCGHLFPRDAQAYRYLTASIEAFPQAEQMATALARAGFGHITFRRMTMGLCTLYIGVKN